MIVNDILKLMDFKLQFTIDGLEIEPDVKEYLKEFLSRNNYDGLYRDEYPYGCGCGLDNFAPCGHILGDCQTVAGKKYDLSL